ncbi:MAG: NAD(P)/FAD-dependent oxidoreductase, partial [Bacteroidetes bacterium]|nr:NAD(P)/FAD-dependent oxidoreductase [Bacteroidota bacterium]
MVEKGGKYFPSTHSAKTILDALLKESQHIGVDLKKGFKVAAVNFRDTLFEIDCGGTKFISKNVVLATGGLSHPSTGSDGSGYGLAKAFGHTLVKTSAALTPLLSNDTQFKTLSGVA